MTIEELIAYQQREKAFAATELGGLFVRYTNALIGACQADARVEYLGRGEKSAREAWARSDKIRDEFKTALVRVL